MAFVAKEWSEQSKAIAHIFAQHYEDGWSLRRLEAASGITYSRLRNIFNVSSAPILLDEFFSLCDAFQMSPVSVINSVMDEGRTEELSGMSDDAAVDLELVAHRDSNKYKEMEDYYD